VLALLNCVSYSLNTDAHLLTVRKVKPTLRLPRRCNFPSLDRTCPGLDIKSDLLAAWDSVKKLCALPRQISLQSASGRTRNGNGYMQAGAHYMRQVSGLLKASVNSLRSTSLMDAPEGIKFLECI
jgi:hypothetical protein